VCTKSIDTRKTNISSFVVIWHGHPQYIVAIWLVVGDTADDVIAYANADLNDDDSKGGGFH
jgi:hypothetical protein